MSLTVVDYVCAAVTAFVATQLILLVSKIFKIFKAADAIQGEITQADMIAVIKKCVEMFPESTINFRGKVFKKGMRVRITTFQKRIIEGEIIGKNELDILCIIAGKDIIAHEIDKIEDITEMNQYTTPNQ